MLTWNGIAVRASVVDMVSAGTRDVASLVRGDAPTTSTSADRLGATVAVKMARGSLFRPDEILVVEDHRVDFIVDVGAAGTEGIEDLDGQLHAGDDARQGLGVPASFVVLEVGDDFAYLRGIGELSSCLCSAAEAGRNADCQLVDVLVPR
jgi:hypothetical protein